MHRVVNLRTMCVVALGETGIVLSLYGLHLSRVGGILGLCAMAAICIAAVVWSIRCEKRAWQTAFLLAIALSVLTAFSMQIHLALYYGFHPTRGETYSLEGTIESVVSQDGYAREYVLGDIRIEGKKVHGKVRVYLEESDTDEREIPVGYRMVTRGTLYTVALFDGKKVNGTAYRQDLRYTAYTTFADSCVAPQTVGKMTRLRMAMRKKLLEACGDTYGSIAYCMMTGDRSVLQADETRLYSMAGIGHVLAVSGLHVGLISSVILFLLRRLHVPKKICAVAACILLCGYAIFVGLGASVVRATVMSIVALLTMWHGERVDPLNSLGMAYAGILATEPFLFFEVGFQMSFGSVFGLILFVEPCARALRKIRMPKAIASALAVTLSAHLGILPVTAYHFGAVKTYSVLFNLFVLPLITFTFVGFVFLLPICMLFGLTAPLRICGGGFALVDTVIGVAPHLPCAEIGVASVGALYLMYPLYFAVSRFLMLGKAKPFVSGVSFVLCVALIVVPSLAIMSIPDALYDTMLCIDAHGEVTTAFVERGRVTVIGDIRNASAMRRTLRTYGVRNVDTILLHKLTPAIGAALADFMAENKVGRVLCPIDEMDADGLAKISAYDNFYIYEESSLPYIQVVTDASGHAGYRYIYACGVQVLAMAYAARYTAVPAETLNETPIVRCFMYLNRYADRVYLTNMPVGYLGECPREQFDLASGSFAYDVIKGEILRVNI